MYWLVTGLLLIGAVCGATIRLMMFIVVLLGAAAIAVAANLSHGVGAATLDAVVAVVLLQVGYVAGIVLRAMIRSRYASNARTVAPERPLPLPFGEKRR